MQGAFKVSGKYRMAKRRIWGDEEWAGRSEDGSLNGRNGRMGGKEGASVASVEERRKTWGGGMDVFKKPYVTSR